MQEYESPADFSNLSKIGIGFTTVTDEEIPIQIYADLENYKIERYLNDVLIDTREYDSLQKFIEFELERLDFSDLIGYTDEDIERVLLDKGEERFIVTETSDAFEKGNDFAVYDRAREDYYVEADGNVQTFENEEDAQAHLEKIKEKQLDFDATCVEVAPDHYIDHFYVVDDLKNRGH